MGAIDVIISNEGMGVTYLAHLNYRRRPRCMGTYRYSDTRYSDTHYSDTFASLRSLEGNTCNGENNEKFQDTLTLTLTLTLTQTLTLFLKRV